MLSDLLIVGITTCLLAVCIYGFKTKYRVLSVILLGIVLVPVMITLVINIHVITSPLTPEVHGKVIDAETKKPLAGINIKAGWYMSSVSVGGGYGKYYKLYTTKTDVNGDFILPRGIKALTFGYLIGKSYFDGVNVTVYPPGYDYKVSRFTYNDQVKPIIALEKVKSDKEFLENISAYWHGLSYMHKGSWVAITDPYERGWMKNAFRTFEKIYPNSREDEPYLERLAHNLNFIKEPECVYVLQKLLDKYPSNINAWRANDAVKLWKQNYDLH